MSLNPISQSVDAVIEKKDIYQQVTDTIIAHLEKGVVPWSCPWKTKSTFSFGMPFNHASGKAYQGVNIVLLWCAALQHNYQQSEWATFKQWSFKKEKIRKGEKGTMIIYYDTYEKEKDGEIEKVPFIKSSYVFNRCQLESHMQEEDNDDDWDLLVDEEVANKKNSIQEIEAIEKFVENTDAWIENEDYGACYIGATDKIYMPYPMLFKVDENYSATDAWYATLFHELIHWTGHPKRLNRERHRKFGDKVYANEELIAEMGSAFLCSDFDISTRQYADQASYIAHWLKVLKENKYAIVKAASEASKAVGYLKGLQPE